jgi:hypothetical protein
MGFVIEENVNCSTNNSHSVLPKVATKSDGSFWRTVFFFFFETLLALLHGISFETTTLIYEQVWLPVLSWYMCFLQDMDMHNCQMWIEAYLKLVWLLLFDMEWNWHSSIWLVNLICMHIPLEGRCALCIFAPQSLKVPRYIFPINVFRKRIEKWVWN